MANAANSTTAPDGFAQPSRWRAFRDPAVEADYRQWHRDQILPIVRAAGMASVVAWALIPLGFLFVLGAMPRAVIISNWAIAVPTLVVFLLASYTGLQRWATQGTAFVNVVVGLDIAWIMSTLYSPHSGTVACGVLSLIFYPLVLRLRTIDAAFVTSVLGAVPVVLLIRSTQSGEITVSDSWPYIGILIVVAPIILVGAAVIEAGMRQQFVGKTQLAASQRLIRRYVPEQVADAVLSGAFDAADSHERRKLTIFFSDLVGFTDLSEELEPEDLATVLHDYFTEMSAIARRHGGTVDDLVGDAILVLFGAPEQTNDRDQALRAVRMAIEMQQAMGPLNERWASAGIPEALTVRMGVNTGVATVGNFGSADRTKYTALGKQVNVAARIQAQCVPGRVLLSHATWLLVHDEIPCTPIGELTLKGLHKPMPAYEVQS